jgi:hypothetical protein
MKLSLTQLDVSTLTQLGADAIELVKDRDFTTLAERYGYALAYQRNLAHAIEEDFDRCLANSEIQSSQNKQSIQVTYFKPSSISIYASVSCITPVSSSKSVLIELVVTADGEEKYITLEDISYAY